jgi:hypothetical protein
MRRDRSRLLSWSVVLPQATSSCLSMCASLRNSRRRRGIYRVPSTYPWVICRTGPGSFSPTGNRSCWFAKPIGALPRQRRGFLPPACGTSPCCVVAPTDGIDRAWHSNSGEGERLMRCPLACRPSIFAVPSNLALERFRARALRPAPSDAVPETIARVGNDPRRYWSRSGCRWASPATQGRRPNATQDG